ncbi:MAG TPA: hypothetical protein VLH56_06390 [Dissulfurispiraceae bacterium]|nr:hypothetical protein [Dissulfurispiraceae bacterium]
MNRTGFDWTKWLPILISGAALAISVLFLSWGIISERARSRAILEVWQRNVFYHGSDDDRTKITLLFRNLSHRPTAVVDLYVREKEGILGGRGYKDRISLPIRIDPWGLTEIDFKIDQNDEVRMTDILVRDIQDKEIVVVRGTGKTWAKARSR